MSVVSPFRTTITFTLFNAVLYIGLIIRSALSLPCVISISWRGRESVTQFSASRSRRKKNERIGFSSKRRESLCFSIVSDATPPSRLIQSHRQLTDRDLIRINSKNSHLANFLRFFLPRDGQRNSIEISFLAAFLKIEGIENREGTRSITKNNSKK